MAEFEEISKHANALDIPQSTRILVRLNRRRRAMVHRLLTKDLALEVFECFGPASQSDLSQGLQEHDTADIFLALDPEDRVWLFDGLPATVASKLFQGLAAF